MSRTFPFVAIVGQNRLKRALVLNAVDPGIGGVLIRGERGTAKSTAVRALADVLPDRDVVADCPYACPPDDRDRMCPDCRSRHEAGARLPTERRPMRVVDLPLNASEDRIVGSFDLEDAVTTGERTFEPGILAEANRNVLYVDEVNLLDDHLVDVLLDAAATGENVVEREGVSVRHPAQFILVGTMNPEEGRLRPQLIDRFGTAVRVDAIDDVEERQVVAERREAFDEDPDGFRESYADEQAALLEEIVAARERLLGVDVPDEVQSLVAGQALRHRTPGLRADIAVRRVARAAAAVDGAATVGEPHVREAIGFAFPHRARGPVQDDPDRVDEDTLHEAIGHEEAAFEADFEVLDAGGRTPKRGGRDVEIADGEGTYPIDREALIPEKDRRLRERFGRRSPSRVDRRSGRYRRARLSEDVDDLALDATLRAAAVHQPRRRARTGGSGPDRIVVEPRDFRQKLRERTAETLIVAVVDASGSVMAGRQMRETKRGVLSLLDDAYRTRDRVAVVAFRGRDASVIAGPTGDVRRAHEAVSGLRVGGNTPLTHGLVTAYEVVRRERRRDEDALPLVVVFSDGKVNVPYDEGSDPEEDLLRVAATFDREAVPTVYVDTGYGLNDVTRALWSAANSESAREDEREWNLTVADALGATYLPLVHLPRGGRLAAGGPPRSQQQ